MEAGPVLRRAGREPLAGLSDFTPPLAAAAMEKLGSNVTGRTRIAPSAVHIVWSEKARWRPQGISAVPGGSGASWQRDAVKILKPEFHVPLSDVIEKCDIADGARHWYALPLAPVKRRVRKRLNHQPTFF
jgi:hypothetical protein